MFEGDLRDLSATELLSSVGEHHAEQRRMEIRLLEHALQWADLNHPDSAPCRDHPGAERCLNPGGPGCPPIREFVAAEFGAMMGLSAGSATNFIGRALVLRHKLPRTFAMVLDGGATPWKACKIADECRDLSEAAAAIVDQKVAGIIDTISAQRLANIVKAAIRTADPEAAEAAAKQKARERGVYVGQSDDHGTKSIWVLAATGDVIRFDSAIDALAAALKTLGDTDTLQRRRAKAIGIIADPPFAAAVLTAARDHTTNNPNDTGDTDAPSETHPATDPSAETATATATDIPTRTHTTTGTDADTEADTDTDAGLPTDADTDADTGVTASRAGATHRPASSDQDTGNGRTDDDHRDHGDGEHSSENGSAGGLGDSAGGCAPGRGEGPTDTDRDRERACDRDRDWVPPEEPSLDDEADRDAPHPATSDLPDPLDTPTRTEFPPWDTGPYPDRGDAADDDPGTTMDPALRRALNTRLAQIQHHAHTITHTTRTSNSSSSSSRVRQTEIYVHLTDHTLATGTGVLRIEELGPALATQLTELIGHGPYVVKPVIDLNDEIHVDAYEIPDRIRERVKLTYPYEQFPYGTAETTQRTDLDHIHPYDPTGPPDQTSTDNLAPNRRFSHRLKTHGGWKPQRLHNGAFIWTSPHGFKFRVDKSGTHPIDNQDDNQ